MQIIDVDVQDGGGLISIAVSDIMSSVRLKNYLRQSEKLIDQVELLRKQRDAWKEEAEHQYGLVQALQNDGEEDYHPVAGALDKYAAGKYPVLTEG
jgi:hypothetical protein